MPELIFDLQIITHRLAEIGPLGILGAWQIIGELQMSGDELLSDGDDAPGESSTFHSSTHTNAL